MNGSIIICIIDSKLPFIGNIGKIQNIRRNTRWYTGKELYNSTMMVILIAIILSLFLFGIDVLFQKLLLLVF